MESLLLTFAFWESLFDVHQCGLFVLKLLSDFLRNSWFMEFHFDEKDKFMVWI